MKRLVVAAVFGVLVGAILIGRAEANWPSQAYTKQPPSWAMAFKDPQRATPSGSGANAFTLTENGACVRLYCSVDCRVKFGASASAATATSTTGNLLPAGSTWTMCLNASHGYASVYVGGAGTIEISESEAP